MYKKRPVLISLMMVDFLQFLFLVAADDGCPKIAVAYKDSHCIYV